MKRTVILALGALLITALLFTAFISGCGSTESPTEKIDKSIQKQGEVKKLHIDYDLNMKIEGDASALGDEFEGLLPFELGINGAADVDSSGDKAKAKGTINLEGLSDIFESLAGASGEMDAETTLGLGMITSMFEDMEFVLLDETLYIKLAGTWYETDASSAGDVAGLGSDVTEGASDIDQDCMEKAMSDPTKFGTAIMTDVVEVGTEQVNNTETKHYKANLDLDKALTQMADAMRECGGAESAGAIEATKSELNDMFKKKEIEMWIDKDNNMLQVKVTVELDPAAIADTADEFGSDSASSGAEGLDLITVTLNLKMSNFNQDIDVSKPSGNIVPLEDLMGGLGGLGSLGGSSGMGGLENLGGTSTTGGTSPSRTGTSTSSSYSR
ncbi:MAG: LolA-like protein [Thermoleophilia bacterium]